MALRAKECEAAGETDEAYVLYRDAARKLRMIVNNVAESERASVKQQAAQWIARATELKTKPTAVVTWGDVSGNIEAKRLLQEALILPRTHPELYAPGETSWAAILLYGCVFHKRTLTNPLD